MQEDANRRASERVPIQFPVFVRGRTSENRDFLEVATALNISMGGALLAVRRQPPADSKIVIELPISPLPDTLQSQNGMTRQLEAEILRSQGDASGFSIWALKFKQPLSC